MSDSPSLSPGTLLAGKFRIERLLGEGGMGAVYEVRHELTRHQRALKLLHPSTQLVPELVRRFLNEASAAGRAGSAHLVETFDAGTLPSGEPYVVMELLDGNTLATMLEAEGRLDVSLAAELVAQAAQGIEAAHRAGIIHRDLKPENLFVTTRDGRPFLKILDFGVSKFATASGAGEAVTRTRAGVMIGSPAYMSPEQMVGDEDVDARSDVYALGVVLYACLTGTLPFRANTMPALAAQVLQGQFTPVETLRPELAPQLVAIAHRALSLDRAARFQSARELGEALRPFCGAVGRATTPFVFADTVRDKAPSAVAAATDVRPATSKRLGWLALGSVAVAQANISLQPPIDTAVLEQEGGYLAVRSSQTQALLGVDGDEPSLLTGPVRLPRGRHRIRLERGGFVPAERDISVPLAQTLDVHVAFEPTPETRAHYVESAESRRTWSIVTMAAGAAVGAGGLTLALLNDGKLPGAQRELALVNRDFERGSGNSCDPSIPHGSGNVSDNEADAACASRLSDATNHVDHLKTARTIGWAAAGVGGAVLITGAVLLVTGDDPHRYDRKPPHRLLSDLRVLPDVSERGFGLSCGASF